MYCSSSSPRLDSRTAHLQFTITFRRIWPKRNQIEPRLSHDRPHSCPISLPLSYLLLFLFYFLSLSVPFALLTFSPRPGFHHVLIQWLIHLPSPFTRVWTRQTRDWRTVVWIQPNLGGPSGSLSRVRQPSGCQRLFVRVVEGRREILAGWGTLEECQEMLDGCRRVLERRKRS